MIQDINLKSIGRLKNDNPLPEIINSIPWEYTVIGAKFLDDTRAIIIKHDTKFRWYSDAYIILLLIFLDEQGLVSLLELPIKDSVNPVHIVKRV